MDLRRAELLIEPLVDDRLREAQQQRLAHFSHRPGSAHPVIAFAGRLLIHAGARLEGTVAGRAVLPPLSISFDPDPCLVLPSDCVRQAKAVERGI